MIKSCWVIWDTIKYMQVQGSIDCKKYTDEKTAILNKYFTKKKVRLFYENFELEELKHVVSKCVYWDRFQNVTKKV